MYSPTSNIFDFVFGVRIHCHGVLLKACNPKVGIHIAAATSESYDKKKKN